MALSLVTAPTVEPLSLDDARYQVKSDQSVDDVALVRWIAAAREHIETLTRRRMITQTWDLKLDAFPACGPLVLPFPPVQSITSVSYVDTNGDTQVWTAGATGYSTSLPTGPQADVAKIYPSHQISYPQTRTQPDAVTVRFVCGYGLTGHDVPSSLRAAMLMLLAHWYLHREAVDTGINSVTSIVPVGVDALAYPYRVF